ncbi:MAG: hypothetical protein ACP5VP_00770 [Candidatus Limnocylindrales bacterium]
MEESQDRPSARGSGDAPRAPGVGPNRGARSAGDPGWSRGWTGGVVWGGGWYGAQERGASGAWLGALLVLLGVAFLAHQLDRALDAWGLITFVSGAALFLGWARGRSSVALWVGLPLLGYGAARLLLGLDLLVGSGWETVGIGLGFVAGWLATWARGPARTWPLLAAAVFLLVGVAQLAAELPEIQSLDRYVVPVVIIVLGVLLIVSGARRRLVRG